MGSKFGGSSPGSGSSDILSCRCCGAEASSGWYGGGGKGVREKAS